MRFMRLLLELSSKYRRGQGQIYVVSDGTSTRQRSFGILSNSAVSLTFSYCCRLIGDNFIFRTGPNKLSRVPPR